MTDRELLELAAKAAGFVPTYQYREKTNSLLWLSQSGFPSTWRPLDDDKEAFQLAVDLQMRVHIREAFVSVDRYKEGTWVGEIQVGTTDSGWNDAPHAATRRAIVMTAAEIGKEMP